MCGHRYMYVLLIIVVSFIILDTLDVNPLFDYFQRHSPVWPSTDGRIQFHTSGSSPVPPISKASVTIANYVLCFCLIVCSSIFYNRLIFC